MIDNINEDVEMNERDKCLANIFDVIDLITTRRVDEAVLYD